MSARGSWTLVLTRSCIRRSCRSPRRQIADWRDDYGLLTRDGQPLQGGVETGFSADAAIRLRLAPHVALEMSVQRIYWRHIDVGEGRCAFGLVVTR